MKAYSNFKPETLNFKNQKLNIAPLIANFKSMDCHPWLEFGRPSGTYCKTRIRYCESRSDGRPVTMELIPLFENFKPETLNTLFTFSFQHWNKGKFFKNFFFKTCFPFFGDTKHILTSLFIV